MRNSDPRVATLLGAAGWELDPRPYLMVGLERSALEEIVPLLTGEGFRALVIDDLESTLFVPADRGASADLDPAQVTPVRLLTFPLQLPADLVGFLAAVTAALAQAGVPVLPLAACRRDHLFVPAAQVDVALAALEGLASEPGRDASYS